MFKKYSVHDTVEQILNFIKSNEIAIPEIQRPFVWTSHYFLSEANKKLAFFNSYCDNYLFEFSIFGR